MSQNLPSDAVMIGAYMKDGGGLNPCLGVHAPTDIKIEKQPMQNYDCMALKLKIDICFINFIAFGVYNVTIYWFGYFTTPDRRQSKTL